MQWSKVTKKVDLIALYHPQYGFHCASGVPCKSLVTFTETPGNVSTWTLHLRNMSSSLSGKYECSFIFYPQGSQTKIYNLLIQKNGKHQYVLCANYGLSMVLSMQSWTESGIACKGDRNWSNNSTNKCKIATAISNKNCNDLVRENIIAVREIVSEKATSKLRSKERLGVHTISEVGG